MADISVDFWTWSSTAASNSPSGSTAIGTGLDDNLRALQAATRGALEHLTSVAGTNTITASMAGLTAYATGMLIRFIPANTNTGATTLNVNSLGAKNIFCGNAACKGGELVASVPTLLSYDGTQFQVLGTFPPIVLTDASGVSAARTWTLPNYNIAPGKYPTIQSFTSGSGTYTTPSGCIYIKVRMWGAGGGGAGGTTNGTSGANTTFSTLTAGGGAANAGAAGTATGGDVNLSGQVGGAASSTATNVAGGPGGAAPMMGVFGPGGQPTGGTGGSAAANTGGGGGGGGGNSGLGGAGGSSGAYCQKIISAPSATYAYSVGAKGTGGTGSTATGTGGDGAAGLIIVEEFYS